MNKPLVLALSLTLGGFSLAQSTEEKTVLKTMVETLDYSETEAKELLAQAEKLQIELSNLPGPRRAKFFKSIHQAKQLLEIKETSKAYYNLVVAHGIFPKSKSMLSNLGAVYLEYRLFEEAYEHYDQVVKESPTNPSFRYNLGESAFVLKKYKEAEDQFRVVGTLLGENNQHQMYQACLVKRQLCLIGQINQASEAGEDTTDLVKSYTDLNRDSSKWEYSLLHHYSMMIEAYRLKDRAKVAQLKKDALYVFPNSAEHNIFVDALIEFGYIESYYGGDGNSQIEVKF